MIAYVEKGIGLHDAIRAAGHNLVQRNGVWESSNDAAVQAIIDGYNVLADQKATRIAAIKTDGMARINLIFPAIKTLDDLDLEAERWKSIAPAARPNPTADYTRLINTYTAAKTAVTSVNACTTKAQIDAVTVAWPA